MYQRLTLTTMKRTRILINMDKANALNEVLTRIVFGEIPPKVTRVNRYKNPDNVPKS